MDFLSTEELSAKWGISESRVVRLAKAGRIPDARLVGKSWIFPPDTGKPRDRRRSENRAGAKEPPFRFPLYLYSVWPEEEIRNRFSPDERTLYEGEKLFFRGEYQKCAELLSALTDTAADRYVRFGALYHICLASVYLRRCGRAVSAYNELQSLYLKEEAHKNEIGFLIRNLDSYFVGNQYYMDDFSMDAQADYPLHMREYLLLECAFSDMLRAQYRGVSVNPMPYEILLRSDGGRFSPLAALTMHLYVGGICRSIGQTGKSVLHIREACRIARERDLEYSGVAYMSKYMQNTYQSALEDDPAQLARLTGISDEMFGAFSYLFDSAGRTSLLHILNATDSMLVSFAIRGKTNKEIASALRLSVNTISKRYSVLLEKTGTHSKKELADWYLKTIKEY